MLFVYRKSNWIVKRKEFRDDKSIWMGLTDQDKWDESERIRCERTGVDRPKGHVALNCSLCGLKKILNGNDLRLTINPSPLMKIFPIWKRLVAQA